MFSSVMQMIESAMTQRRLQINYQWRPHHVLAVSMGMNHSTSCMWRTKYYFMVHCHVLLCFGLYSIMCLTWSTVTILSLLHFFSKNLCLNYQPPLSLSIKRVLHISLSLLTFKDTLHEYLLFVFTSVFDGNYEHGYELKYNLKLDKM